MPDPGWRLGGRYTLLDRLGAGVAGEVWRGRDESTGTECAVKLLRSELVQDEGALARMRATVAWISQLTHPNIVPVDDIVAVTFVDAPPQDSAVAEDTATQDAAVQDSPTQDTATQDTATQDTATQDTATQDTVVLISRLVPGESLRSLLDRQGTLPTGTALSLAAQVCDALAAARHVGVAHGDVKPSNLLLESDAQSQIALRLTDFGMAALLSRAVVQQTVAAPTADANAGGEYVAPELGPGEPPTEAGDVYAAGVVLYEALTGEPPFGRKKPGPTRRDASAAASLPADLPDSVADALADCLNENPRHRPSAADLADVLRQASGTLETAGALETVPPAPDVEIAPGPNLGFFGAEAEPGEISDPDLLPALIEKRETAVAQRAGAVVATRGARRAAERARGPRPWTIVAAATCGVALAVFITFGLTTHGSPHANASTLPTRVAVGPAGTSTLLNTATPTPTSTPAPTASAGASATPSPSPATPSKSPAASASASATPSPSSSAGPVVAHTGRLLNQGSNTCLDTSGGYYADGVVEQIWTCNNGSNQVFTLASTGQLTIDGGQYCLDDATSADATGTHPELFTCGSQSHQRWTMRSDGSILGDHSGLCLNAPGNDDGTQLDFEPCSGQTHQHWFWD